MQIHIWELVEAGIIDEATAGRIQAFYNAKKAGSSNKIFIIFGILGAILVGLGILLLVAHNWDDYTRETKSFLAFLPILTGQVACAFTLWKKQDAVAWREGSSVFLFFALGAGIALISQIYHMDGDESSFILAWMSLSLPLVYIMRASFTSVVFLAGNAYFGFLTGYALRTEPSHYLFWVYLLAVLPFYIHLIRSAKNSLFTYLHHWAFVFSVVVNLGTLAHAEGYWLIVAYMALFGLLLLVGNIARFRDLLVLANAYRFVGWGGSLVLLYVVSFESLWSGELSREYSSVSYYYCGEFYMSVVLIAGLLIGMFTKGVGDYKNPIQWAAILLFVLFVLQSSPLLATLTINFYTLGLGLFIIVRSLRDNHLAGLNLGLGIIGILIFCRFFDTNIPFIVKGFLFLVIGTGFFAANYYMVKIRKKDEK